MKIQYTAIRYMGETTIASRGVREHDEQSRASPKPRLGKFVAATSFSESPSLQRQPFSSPIDPASYPRANSAAAQA